MAERHHLQLVCRWSFHFFFFAAIIAWKNRGVDRSLKNSRKNTTSPEGVLPIHGTLKVVTLKVWKFSFLLCSALLQLGSFLLSAEEFYWGTHVYSTWNGLFIGIEIDKVLPLDSWTFRNELDNLFSFLTRLSMVSLFWFHWRKKKELSYCNSYVNNSLT